MHNVCTVKHYSLPTFINFYLIQLYDFTIIVFSSVFWRVEGYNPSPLRKKLDTPMIVLIYVVRLVVKQ